MSEATQEREQELVTGVIESVIVKGEGKWQVVVRPDGSQYTKNLWTKSESQASAATAKIGQHGAFPCSVSHWTNQDGKPVRSLWLAGSEEGGTQNEIPETYQNATPAGGSPMPATTPQIPRPDQMTKEEWARKDSAIHKMACIKTAAAVLTHTLPSQPSLDDLNTFLSHVTHLTSAWHRMVLAERDDPTGEEIPF